MSDINKNIKIFVQSFFLEKNRICYDNGNNVFFYKVFCYIFKNGHRLNYVQNQKVMDNLCKLFLYLSENIKIEYYFV